MKQTQTIKASEFKAKCLKLMDDVADSGQELIITKNQKPVAKLTPYIKKTNSLLGIAKNQGKITGDIISPLDIDWDSQTDRRFKNL
ncbi:MAG: type II toxin-antitoxin system prevent-host-death family antitoxin [Candidatus Saccharibacteria bacterium]|nr:type II toxin-antitoxin system prevent-host-death family antitoxin [Candidatus Saccharibacteria bacterium]